VHPTLEGGTSASPDPHGRGSTSPDPHGSGSASPDPREGGSGSPDPHGRGPASPETCGCGSPGNRGACRMEAGCPGWSHKVRDTTVISSSMDTEWATDSARADPGEDAAWIHCQSLIHTGRGMKATSDETQRHARETRDAKPGHKSGWQVEIPFPQGHGEYCVRSIWTRRFPRARSR
jgi:hypothetical protein